MSQNSFVNIPPPSVPSLRSPARAVAIQLNESIFKLITVPRDLSREASVKSLCK